MKVVIASALAALAACAFPSGESVRVTSPAAQVIVDRTAGENADIARLSIHAVPPETSSLRIVASTVAGRLGEASDAEDVAAFEGGKETVLHEGKNLDYTVPVRDPSGRPLAVIGITISGTAGDNDAMLARAKQLASEIAGELRTARLW
jgi:hypothetical protein